MITKTKDNVQTQALVQRTHFRSFRQQQTAIPENNNENNNNNDNDNNDNNDNEFFSHEVPFF